MMSNFELESRHKKFLNNIRNKWRTASSKHMEKVEQIKLKNKNLEKLKDKQFKKRLKTREFSVKNILERNKMKKIEERNRYSSLSDKKSEEAAKNLELFHKLQEEERQKLEQETFEKSK